MFKPKLLWGGGLRPVLLARKLTLNSDAAPNYKHIFSRLRDPLLPQ